MSVDRQQLAGRFHAAFGTSATDAAWLDVADVAIAWRNETLAPLRAALSAEFDPEVHVYDPCDACCGSACTPDGCHESHPAGQVCLAITIRHDRETEALDAADSLKAWLRDEGLVLLPKA